MKILNKIMAILAVAMLLTACSSNSGKHENLQIKSGEALQGKIHTNKEPDRRVKWNISNCNENDILVSVAVNNKTVFEEANLNGEYKLSKDNSDYFISFKNKSKDNIQPSIDCKYIRIGSSGTITNTITNKVSLSKK